MQRIRTYSSAKDLPVVRVPQGTHRGAGLDAALIVECHRVLSNYRTFAFAVRPIIGRGVPLVLISGIEEPANTFRRRAARQNMSQHVENLAGFDVPVLGFAACPHRVVDDCFCRKPKPGLLFACRDYLRISLEKSVHVGAGSVDLESGARAGVRTEIVSSEMANYIETFVFVSALLSAE